MWDCIKECLSTGLAELGLTALLLAVACIVGGIAIAGGVAAIMGPGVAAAAPVIGAIVAKCLGTVIGAMLLTRLTACIMKCF